MLHFSGLLNYVIRESPINNSKFFNLQIILTKKLK